MAQDELPQTYLITPSDFDHTVFCDDLARVLDAPSCGLCAYGTGHRDETRILRRAMPCVRYVMRGTWPL